MFSKRFFNCWMVIHQIKKQQGLIDHNHRNSVVVGNWRKYNLGLNEECRCVWWKRHKIAQRKLKLLENLATSLVFFGDSGFPPLFRKES